MNGSTTDIPPENDLDPEGSRKTSLHIRLERHFWGRVLSGFLVLLPLIITAWVLVFAFHQIDGLFGGLSDALIRTTPVDEGFPKVAAFVAGVLSIVFGRDAALLLRHADDPSHWTNGSGCESRGSLPHPSGQEHLWRCEASDRQPHDTVRTGSQSRRSDRMAPSRPVRSRLHHRTLTPKKPGRCRSGRCVHSHRAESHIRQPRIRP